MPSSAGDEGKFRLRGCRHWEKSGCVLWAHQLLAAMMYKEQEGRETSPSV